MTQFAFVFPGQGSQSLEMLANMPDAADVSGVIQTTFVEASEGAGVDLWTLTQQGPEDQLNQTEFTQPALLAASVALHRLWLHRGGAKPSALAGHSLGEYSALVAAGVFALSDAAKLVRVRGQAMQSAVAGAGVAMAAILGAEDEVVTEACVHVAGDEVVSPANFNSKGQVVIAGHAAAIDRAIAHLAEQGVKKAIKLAVSVPSHCALMQPAQDALATALAEVPMNAPSMTVYHNVDAKPRTDLDAIRQALVDQLVAPVQWTACARALFEAGATQHYECGPGKVLTGLARRIDRGIAASILAEPEAFDAALADHAA